MTDTLCTDCRQHGSRHPDGLCWRCRKRRGWQCLVCCTEDQTQRQGTYCRSCVDLLRDLHAAHDEKEIGESLPVAVTRGQSRHLPRVSTGHD